MTLRAFRTLIKRYYAAHGRHDLPFRPPSLKIRKDGSLDPYRVFVSEMMLQQTQVPRVALSYSRFVKKFPTVRALAKAPLSAVLAAWSGLGYNRRAVYLKRAAERIVREHGGRVPAEAEQLRALPGVGRNTAAAICVYAFDRPAVFIETNIRRAFIHHFFPRRRQVSDDEILPLVAAVLPRRDIRAWYYALMDYGTHLAAALPKRGNPNRRSRHYARQAKFEGSARQLRGAVLRELLRTKRMRQAELVQRLRDGRAARIARAMAAEGILRRRGTYFEIAD
jgi:A/G-specific adenine glycosylase